MKKFSFLMIWGLALLSVSNGDEAMNAQLTDASNCFTVSLYKEMGKGKPNMVASPFSVHVLLSLLRVGAGKTTLKELTDHLGYDNLSVPDMEDAYQAQLAKQKSKDGNTLDIADSIWIENSFPINSSFLSIAKTKFGSSIKNVNFKTKARETTQEINKWGEMNTNGMIPTILDEDCDPGTVMVLVNAMYFNGTWENQFDPKDTVQGQFYNGGSKNNPSTVDFMTQQKRFNYGSSDNYEVLEMKYVGGSVSMFFILPKEGSSMDDFEMGLTCDLLKKAIASTNSKKVSVTIPKFDISSKYDLKTPLMKIGIKDMFTSDANFEGISPNIAVSGAVQKCIVKVKEGGTEAAVVTAMEMAGASFEGNEEKPINFKADRPFLFMIQERTSGIILFMGRANELKK